MVIAIPSASTVQGVARTSREGDRDEHAGLNSELGHPPERGVPKSNAVRRNVTTTTTTMVDPNHILTGRYALAAMICDASVGRAPGAWASEDVVMDFPEINGFGHIDLTVTDGERSVRWWEQVLGFTLVGKSEKPSYKRWNMYHPSFLAVGLTQFANGVTDRFDERAVGLDHLALRVPNRAVLDACAKHLDQLGIAHSGVQEERGGPLIVLRDPDNIQLELWAFDWDLV
jgi:catechol 2,3-dioxygenase-like lactoylglutathione lyase family enzyme